MTTRNRRLRRRCQPNWRICLRRLRLPHIRRHAPEVVATAKAQRWEPAEVLKALFAEEVAGRERSALATRRAAAGFPTGKTFDAWQPEASSIPAPTQQALRTLEWVHRRENLVVCGPSGTGKTFLLEALGQQAVETGLKVAWFTLEDLGVLLRRHRADDTVTKAIARSCAPTWSSSTTSACCRSPPTPPKGSTGSSTPPTRNARSRSARTCTHPGSTN
jgi:DNA replication protein DnaC